MRQAGFATLILVLTGMAPAAGVAGSEATDRQIEFLDGCLAGATDTGEDLGRCVGSLSQPCKQRPENQSNQGVVACYQIEESAWDTLRRRFEAQLGDGLDGEEARAALLASDEAWRAYREESCALSHVVAPDDAALVWAAACQCEKTAERAIDLYRLLPLVGF